MINMLNLIADHHNRLDTTELDIFFLFLVVVCFSLGYYINRLLKNEEQKQQNDQK